MLGVIPLYVGSMVFDGVIGLHRLEGIPDKSNVVKGISFTGGLDLILATLLSLLTELVQAATEWFYGSATGLLFALPIFTQRLIRFLREF